MRVLLTWQRLVRAEVVQKRRKASPKWRAAERKRLQNMLNIRWANEMQGSAQAFHWREEEAMALQHNIGSGAATVIARRTSTHKRQTGRGDAQEPHTLMKQRRTALHTRKEPASAHANEATLSAAHTAAHSAANMATQPDAQHTAQQQKAAPLRCQQTAAASSTSQVHLAGASSSGLHLPHKLPIDVTPMPTTAAQSTAANIDACQPAARQQQRDSVARHAAICPPRPETEPRDGAPPQLPSELPVGMTMLAPSAPRVTATERCSTSCRTPHTTAASGGAATCRHQHQWAWRSDSAPASCAPCVASREKSPPRTHISRRANLHAGCNTAIPDINALPSAQGSGEPQGAYKRRYAVDGLLVFRESARERIEAALGQWWWAPAPFGDG